MDNEKGHATHFGWKNVVTLVIFTAGGLLVTLSMTSLYHNAITISKCLPSTRDSILNTSLLVGAKGQVGVNIRAFSGCFRVNSSKSGMSRYMDEANFREVDCGDVNKRFVNDSGNPVKTALASLPGSGNTWVRHLIEELTGLYTGSIYHSKRIGDTFKGENRTNGVIVVKTHQSVQAAGYYDRLVLIVRDPFDTILAQFNLKKTKSKTGVLTREQFDYRLFIKTLRAGIPEWCKFYENWLEFFPGPIFVLFYEQLKNDLYNSMAKLATFLGTNVSLRDLWCVSQRQEGSYHRGPKPAWMARSRIVDVVLDKEIGEGRRRLYDRCLNSTTIQTNL